jgi:hypothetical protein
MAQMIDIDEKELFKKIGIREDFDPNNRVVKQDRIRIGKKLCLVSTVDLGIDHNYFGNTPLYYETMIFRINNGFVNFSDLFCERYPTRDEALAGHNKIIESIKLKKLKLYNYDIDEKYARRIKNRQKLYVKLKKLGRKL